MTTVTLSNPIATNDLQGMIETLKSSLMDRAVGGTGTLTTAEYAHIRRALLEHPRVKDRLPAFIKKCRTIDEFWSYIKGAYGSYAERRAFLAEHFNPLLDDLESDNINVAETFDTGPIIGQGGFGIVYKRRHKLLDTEFAFKIFAPAFESTEDSDHAIARFFREARILFELHNPYIIRIYDVGIENKRPFIKMEFFDGINLYEAMRKHGTIPYQKTLRIIKCIVLAINHAHEKGILHRDLKPSNVMIKPGQQLRVIDFGLGVYIENYLSSRITKTGHGIAGGVYTAPELLHDPKIKDVRCDIYSIGAIWYYLLTGRPPAGADIKEALERIHQIPSNHRDVVISCLLRFEERLSNCARLLSQIEQIEQVVEV